MPPPRRSVVPGRSLTALENDQFAAAIPWRLQIVFAEPFPEAAFRAGQTFLASLRKSDFDLGYMTALARDYPFARGSHLCSCAAFSATRRNSALEGTVRPFLSNAAILRRSSISSAMARLRSELFGLSASSEPFGPSRGFVWRAVEMVSVDQSCGGFIGGICHTSPPLAQANIASANSLAAVGLLPLSVALKGGWRCRCSL